MSAKGVAASVTQSGIAGTWRVYARRPGFAPLEITYFRGVPTGYGTWTLSDPFGAKTASIVLPKVTIFDRIGSGDLEWLVYGTDIDIVWDGESPWPFRVETFAVSFDYSTNDGLTVSLQGAMYQLDNYLAKPLFPSRPIPYERAIEAQFYGHPDLRLRSVRTVFPAVWDTVYKDAGKNTAAYLKPTGVQDGQKWTGLVTRQTGSFEPSLTSYVQTLLASMYTDNGRWTLDLDPGRQPVLFHREVKAVDAPDVLVIDPATPGVEVRLNVDWSQSLNVAYGQGQSLTGEGYTGLTISADGQRTTYEPLASLRQVHPESDNNGWYEPERMRKEVALQLQAGLSLSQARGVGYSHLNRYADPGVTGSITLAVDPYYNGVHVLRTLIRPGMSMRLPNLFGSPVGVMVHISDVSVDLSTETVTLTVDSKYRDSLTVDEVRQRGRDSLGVVRQLIGGQYQPLVPDQLLPWNYAEGSGYIPSGADFSSQPLFSDIPDDVTFPYEEVTTARPPSDPAWSACYMKVSIRSVNADENWGAAYDVEGNGYAFPVKMSQAGSIRRLQIAAYDENGNILPVRFHFSLYQANGTAVTSMPRILGEDLATADGYQEGQHYPFFASAWEQFKADGTKIQTEDKVSVSSAGLVRAWGTRYVKAGYWPGSPVGNDPATGMLVDEGSFEFDTTNFDLNFSPFVPRQISSLTGHLYAMIYCDEQYDQDVYFAGRMFRAEPGTSV